jgi:DNA polymerase family A
MDFTMSIGARTCFWAPKGRCILSLDFSSQELRLAAVMSQDPVMLEVFKQPEKIMHSNGKEVSNPAADLHTQTARAVFPQAFVENGLTIPEEDWVEAAKDAKRIGKTKSARDYAKCFGAH